MNKKLLVFLIVCNLFIWSINLDIIIDDAKVIARIGGEVKWTWLKGLEGFNGSQRAYIIPIRIQGYPDGIIGVDGYIDFLSGFMVVPNLEEAKTAERYDNLWVCNSEYDALFLEAFKRGGIDPDGIDHCGYPAIKITRYKWPHKPCYLIFKGYPKGIQGLYEKSPFKESTFLRPTFDFAPEYPWKLEPAIAGSLG